MLPTRFELVTAKTLGIEVPLSVPALTALPEEAAKSELVVTINSYNYRPD
jgi:hypothetical protein